jgi:hypothetical protein
MQRVADWNAYQSGGAFTITGFDTAGRPVKLRRVDRLESSRGWFRTTVFALNRSGVKVARLV